MAFTSGELRDFVDAVRGSETSTECVVTGTVVRVDVDGTAWVQIGQNPEPTPCARNMACHAGDEVTVRIADHKATVTGNASAPATDDKKANVAYNYAGVAQETATVAQDTAEVAQNTANQAKKVASNAATKADVAEIAAQEAARVASAVNQHFWDDERGAHVTEEEREDYETQASGFQQLMTSIGTLLTRAVNGIEYLLRSDTQSGMAIYDGTCTADDANLAQHMVASFTAQGAQIGKNSNSHIELGETSLKMVNRSAETYMDVEDLNGDASNPVETDDVFLGDGQLTFELSYTPSTLLAVYKDGVEVTTGYTVSGRSITFTSAPRTVYVYYQTQEVVPCFTYGSRAEGSAKGLSSTVEGITNEASGKGAHAEGINTVASGTVSHTEGIENTASGFSSHAEGQGTEATGEASHAEGQSTDATALGAHAEGISASAGGSGAHAEGISASAGGSGAHAEGISASAVNEACHAEGYHTIARNNFNATSPQHVQGRWNIEDTQGTYAHIIGNGTSDSNRSNAHTVDWSGNGWYAGNVSADGALSCADGSPYCKDGTDVKVGGTTVGSADNLSYVASTDTIRSPTASNGTRTSATSGGWALYYRIGRLVVVSFTLNVTTITRNTVVVTGLPLGLTTYAESAFTVGAASQSRTVPMHVDLTTGNLMLSEAAPSAGWYSGTITYVSAS